MDCDTLNCDRCGSENVETGTLFSSYGVAFRPSDAKWYSSGSPLYGIACTDCGYVALFVDVEKFERCPRKQRKVISS